MPTRNDEKMWHYSGEIPGAGNGAGRALTGWALAPRFGSSAHLASHLARLLHRTSPLKRPPVEFDPT